jgi:hypothetical protein
MTFLPVHIRELAAWGFDEYEYRPKSPEAKDLRLAAGRVAQREGFEQSNVLLAAETEELTEEFAAHAERPDLLAEMSGLSWSLGVVDVRPLIAFQRRLSFHPERPQVLVPDPRQWPALLSLCFGFAKPIECQTGYDRSAKTLTVQSSNPNLHFRITGDPATPIGIHSGGPFFEVACFRGRWFLRDGYHRAYALLNAGAFEIPAVIVYPTSIEELGADKPRFFSEEVLFSEAPPRIIDFLDNDLVLEYDRPPLIKTLRIKIEETLQPANCTGEQS